MTAPVTRNRAFHLTLDVGPLWDVLIPDEATTQFVNKRLRLMSG